MKLQKLNRALFGALMVSGALGAVSQAHATLYITPSSTPAIFVNSTSNLDANAVEGLVFTNWNLSVQLGLAFKQDSGGESGTAAPYYTGSITPASDPSAGTISWDGPLMKISCPYCFLTVKDGNQGNPAQYVFNISGWNGTDTIDLSGFWAGTQGSISNIAIWNYTTDTGNNPGGTVAAIPEADTYAMLLAGLGLVGFAARRKLA